VHCCCRCSNRDVYASFGIGRRGAGVGRNQAYKICPICPIFSRNSLPPRGSKQDAPSLRAAVVQGGLRRMPLGANNRSNSWAIKDSPVVAVGEVVPEATVSAGEASRQVGEEDRTPNPIPEPNVIRTSDRAAATSAPAMIGPHCRKEVLISTGSTAISSVSSVA
jgi:hypothetical protein